MDFESNMPAPRPDSRRQPHGHSAEFALNEGAWGEMDAAGKRVAMQVEAAEKFPQNYRLEVTNPGGHSSRPVKDNAIYRLAAALTRIAS